MILFLKIEQKHNRTNYITENILYCSCFELYFGCFDLYCSCFELYCGCFDLYCSCFNLFCNVWVCVGVGFVMSVCVCFLMCGCFGGMCTCI